MKDAANSEKQMTQTASSIMVDLRIPGRWANPRELIGRLPNNCRATPQALILANGVRIDLGFLPPDDQFPRIFRSTCRGRPTKKELAAVEGYTVNVTLSGRGGSIEAARTIMKAAGIMVRAGGAGVFIDNSALSHGAKLWIEMAEDGGIDALSFAFVGIIQDNADIWTVGMHVFGLRDIVLKRADLNRDFDIVGLIRSMVRGDKPLGNILSDNNGSWFSCYAEDGDAKMVATPMHNPFGHLRLVKLRPAANKTS
jgi:hypothetical protein